MKYKKQLDLLAIVGLVCILVCQVLPLAGVTFTVTRTCYTVSAAVYLLARLMLSGEYAHHTLRIRRLYRLQLWSAIFFGVAAVMMYLRTASHTDWVAFTLAGAVLVTYSTFMIGRLLRRDA